MSNSQLVGTSFIDGLRAPHYINGRLLAAEDLKADQEATLTRMAWVGKAAGYGIVEGLVVEQSGNDLRVQKGLGLNREGQPVRLPGPITLSLQLPPDEQVVDDAGRFHTCTLKPGGVAGIGGGAYLLTALPVSRLEGSAPLKGSAGSAISPGCAARWEVEGLQFKAIRLAGFPDSAPANDKHEISKLRSRLAHWCYGSEALKALPFDPLHFAANYTGLSQIDPADMSPCDLPLAVFYWTGSSLTFVDAWSARRRLIHPEPLGGWYGVLDDRRAADGQARFVQFQAHLDALATEFKVSPPTVSATGYFEWLPPVGFLPLGNGGFDFDTFFDGLPIKRIGIVGFDYISRRLYRSLFEQSLDLSNSDDIVIYIVPEVFQTMLRGRGLNVNAARANELKTFANAVTRKRGTRARAALSAWLRRNRLADDQVSAQVQPYLVFARDEPLPYWFEGGDE